MPDPRDIMGGLAADDAYRGEYPDWPPSPSYPPRVPSVLETGEPPRDFNDYMGALARPGPDTLAPPPRSDLGRDVPAFLGKQVFPNLSNPDTYATPSAALTPNDQGKVPTANPLAMGAAADIGNTLNYAIPFGGPLKAAPAAAAGLKAIFAGVAAKTADRVALAQAERMAASGAEMSVSGKIGDLAEPNATGIRGYHSSPHDLAPEPGFPLGRFNYDKFKFTGEGANMMGPGTYIGGSEKVSGRGGHYWNQFLSKFEEPEANAARRLQAEGWDRTRALTAAQTAESYWGKKFTGASAYGVPSDLKEYGRMRDLARAEAELLRGGKPVGPRTYEVNINARPEQFLDWDRPLAQQSPNVEDALFSKLMDRLPRKKATEELDLYQRKTGDQLYRAFGGDSREASQFLQSEGIPGIRYLDAGSRITSPVASRMIDKVGSRAEALKVAEERFRTAGQGDSSYWDSMVKMLQPETHNTVVFPGNEHLVEILKKYGIAGAAPAGLGALAAQDRYEQ